MNPATVQLLIQLLNIAIQLAPEVTKQIQGIRDQTGKSAEEIFADAGVTIDANTAKAMSILTELMAQQ